MQVNHYGLTRPAAIAAKLAALRAHCFRVPVATEAPEVETAAPAAIEAPAAVALEVATCNEPFVARFPHLAAQHVQAQRRMFAAIKGADLPVEIVTRLAGINNLLGTRYTTSRALSPDDLHAVADAIEARRFSGAWELDAALPCDDAPLPEAPDETEAAPESVGVPASLAFLDEIALEFEMSQMRAADSALAVDALRSERVLLSERLRAVDHAILCA